MSTPTTVRDDEPGPADGSGPADRSVPADDSAGARGRLEIADRVIERIAVQAATEVDLATGAPRRMLGVSVGSPTDRPDVSARVDGHVAIVDVVMSVAAVNSSKQLASFSQRNAAVDIAAPGVAVNSTIPGGGYAAWERTHGPALAAGRVP